MLRNKVVVIIKKVVQLRGLRSLLVWIKMMQMNDYAIDSFANFRGILLIFATASESRSGFVFFWDIYQTLHVLKIPLMWLYYVHNKFNLVVCPWVLIFKMFPCKSYNCKKKTFIFIFVQVSYRYVLNCPWSFLHSMNNSFDWKVTELFLVLV